MYKCNRCFDREAKIIVTDEGQERLCNRCFNDMVSEEIGVMLETMPEEIVVNDFSGTRRDFTVQQRLYPNGIFLEAVEDLEYGYQYSVHGELDCNQTELFHKLVNKVKLNVSKRYTKAGEFRNGQKYLSIIDDEVGGRIDYDDSNPSVPMVVVDGRPYTWEQLGEMIMRFEGFQFKMNFFDQTDEVE
ncbi:hypothetical protein LC048_24470 [Mesobacillus subterraneus]|uniref:DUF7713 domain-containing protein n=1 Tax=Mesobacillus subterraneus TaxID=285983 RepID=UPI001CFCC927|nr:hypothetical protein [Mesobacillus subterraneus]WLR55379.1 hypothetical protein LC048_24470 [Mesobacillus subterraneus]